MRARIWEERIERGIRMFIFYIYTNIWQVKRDARKGENEITRARRIFLVEMSHSQLKSRRNHRNTSHAPSCRVFPPARRRTRYFHQRCIYSVTLSTGIIYGNVAQFHHSGLVKSGSSFQKYSAGDSRLMIINWSSPIFRTQGKIRVRYVRTTPDVGPAPSRTPGGLIFFSRHTGVFAWDPPRLPPYLFLHH